jgi:PAS domain S-box-containing protein
MIEKNSMFIDYHRLVDLFPEMMLVLNDEYQILDANQAAKKIMSISILPSHLRPIVDLIAEDARDAFEYYKPLRDQKKIETKLQTQNHSSIDVMMSVRVLHSDKKQFVVLFIQDITEDKKKRLDLLRFSNVIHNTINPIQITDANGIMVYVNPAFEKVSGYSSAELVGTNPKILNSGKHNKEFWGNVWKHILSGKIWVGRVENKRKDGNPFFAEVVISPIINEQGTIAGYLGAHRDITEQTMLEQQLVRSQRMESIGTLAAGIAHEVGNPLTAISSLVQVIQRTSKEEFAKEKLELINSQVNRIARIIRELVDFARPTTHVVKPTDLNKVIREALNIVQYGKKVKNINFILELKDPLPIISVVPDQVVQVFINIFMNAVDALEGNAGDITTRSRKTEKGIEVTVRDTGKGIEPTEVNKIFEPFYTTKPTGQGTGLGLWVSYGIVKSFGGIIFVESIPLHGSLFTITFPIEGAL